MAPINTNWLNHPIILLCICTAVAFAHAEYGFQHELFSYEETEQECQSVLSAYRTAVGSRRLTYAKTKALQNCIYDFLEEEYRKREENQTLWREPPFVDTDGSISISIKDANLIDFAMNEVQRSYVGVFSFTMAWDDSRLTWRTLEWDLRNITLREPGFRRIWMPSVASFGSNDFSRKEESPDYNDDHRLGVHCSQPVVRFDGKVSCRVEPQWSLLDCVHSLHNYPNDEFSCCTKLMALEDRGQLRFQVSGSGAARFPSTKSAQHFLIRSAAMLLDDEDKDGVSFCVNGERRQEMLRIELSLPMAIAAIVALVSPLLPGLKQQTYVKLFALLLQFLGFQFLFYNHPELSMADQVPRLHRFYEFTVAITITSLLLTYIVTMLLNCKRFQNLPPPRRALFWADFVNMFCGCLTWKQKINNSHVENGNAGITTTSTEAECNRCWSEVWIAAHNFVSVLLAVVYLLGLLIILV